MEQMFDVIVFYFNEDCALVRGSHYFYDRTTAKVRAKEFTKCDNVNRVEVINHFTGELILASEDGKIVWDFEENGG